MKYYAHNVGDWLPATVDLSCTEEGVYRRLMDWYYSNEQPLPHAARDLNKIARTRTAADREAVRVITSRYFTLTEDGWHHDRIDKALKTFSMGDVVRTAKRDAAAERQRRSRAKRDASWAALISRGIQAPFKATQSELDNLLISHGVTQVVTRDGVRDITRDTGRDLGRDLAKTNNQSNTGAPADAAAPRADARAAPAHEGAVVVLSPTDPSRVGAAGRALKAAGFPMLQANTADPRFVALLQAGVTDDELRLTAAEAVARAKGWGWLVATIAGRHADVAAGFAPARPAKGPNRRDPDRVAGLTPTIAQKRQESA